MCFTFLIDIHVLQSPTQVQRFLVNIHVHVTLAFLAKYIVGSKPLMSSALKYLSLGFV